MIDNFSIINGILEYNELNNDTDAYYHLQIIQRKKDIPNLGCNNVLLKAIIIDNEHPLNRFKEDIISLCEYYKARAYINVGPKSKKKTAVHMLRDLAECFEKGDFNYIKRLWNTAAGTVPAIQKRWVIDCDWSEKFTEKNVNEIIRIVNDSMPEGMNVIAKVPTLNGVHLITKSFDSRSLKEVYPDIDLHKNNPTVLYVPNSLM